MDQGVHIFGSVESFSPNKFNGDRPNPLIMETFFLLDETGNPLQRTIFQNSMCGGS